MKKFLISAMLTISLCLYAQVGIQTSTPDLNSDLTLGSPDKGLLLNRVALKNTSSSSPLAENTPAGMLVYNTQTTTHLLPGVYVYDGEDWGEVNVKSPTRGNKLTKIMYRGGSLDPPTLKIPEMNIEFRISVNDFMQTIFEFRLLTPPTEEVTCYSSMLSSLFITFPAVKFIFTPENYNIWQSDMYTNYYQSYWGVLISTNIGISDSNTGIFYGTYEKYAFPDNAFYFLSFDLF